MTRQEAIQVLNMVEAHGLADEAKRIAIEALSQPIVAKHFDIQNDYIYCSPQIAKNVKVVVLCKDCKHYKSDGGALMVCSITEMITDDDDYCSCGERREP